MSTKHPIFTLALYNNTVTISEKVLILVTWHSLINHFNDSLANHLHPMHSYTLLPCHLLQFIGATQRDHSYTHRADTH